MSNEDVAPKRGALCKIDTIFIGIFIFMFFEHFSSCWIVVERSRMFPVWYECSGFFRSCIRLS